MECGCEQHQHNQNNNSVDLGTLSTTRTRGITTIHISHNGSTKRFYRGKNEKLKLISQGFHSQNFLGLIFAEYGVKGLDQRPNKSPCGQYWMMKQLQMLLISYISPTKISSEGNFSRVKTKPTGDTLTQTKYNYAMSQAGLQTRDVV